MDQAEHDVLAFMGFHTAHRAKISSTNPLKRVNGEIKRRSDVVGTYPNEAAGPAPGRRLAPGAAGRVGCPAPLHAARDHGAHGR